VYCHLPASQTEWTHALPKHAVHLRRWGGGGCHLCVLVKKGRWKRWSACRSCISVWMGEGGELSATYWPVRGGPRTAQACGAPSGEVGGWKGVSMHICQTTPAPSKHNPDCALAPPPFLLPWATPIPFRSRTCTTRSPPLHLPAPFLTLLPPPSPFYVLHHPLSRNALCVCHHMLEPSAPPFPPSTNPLH
jgi:hypothetical protein